MIASPVPASTSPSLPHPAQCLQVLIAARGAEAAALARALFGVGYNVMLRTTEEDVFARLSDKSPPPSLVIIDPVDMSSCLPALASLDPRPSFLAATGDRRPAELIRALQSGLYQGWLAYPLAIEDSLATIQQLMMRRYEAQTERELARALLSSSADIMQAAKATAAGTMVQAEAEHIILAGLEIAGAVEDMRALLSGRLFFSPAFRSVQTLMRPILEKGSPLLTKAKINTDLGEAAHIGLKCDGPLMRRAILLMLMQASYGQNRQPGVRLQVASQDGVTISVMTDLNANAAPSQPWQYAALSELYCMKVAHLHAGRFTQVRNKKYAKQVLSINAQPGPWPTK